MGSVDGRGRLWRSRWAAIGAAVAVTFGAGGLVAVNAAGGVDSTTVMTDPVRVLDSRDPTNVGLAGPFVSQVPQKLQITGSIPTTTGTKTVVPSGATGVLLNVTAVAPTANGFISIRPGDATGLPSTSSLNVDAGQVIPNAVTVALPTTGANTGKIDITFDAYGTAGRSTDILIDVVGYTTQLDVYTKAQADAATQTAISSALQTPLVFSTGTAMTIVAHQCIAVLASGGVLNAADAGKLVVGYITDQGGVNPPPSINNATIFLPGVVFKTSQGGAVGWVEVCNPTDQDKALPAGWKLIASVKTLP